MIQTFTDAEICDLVEVAYFRPFSNGLLLGKGSAYKKLIGIGLQRMVETGINKKEHRNYFVDKPKCSKAKIEVVPVDFYTIVPPLIVYLWGAALSVVVLLAEIFYHKYISK